MSSAKECIYCGIVKDISCFRYRKKKSGSDYYHMAQCKDCERKKEKDSYYANHEENKKKLRAKIRYVYYGITEKQYNELIEKQNNSCAICGTNTPGGRGGWHVDHCHETNKIRGLLCHCCNTGLGLFKDDTNLLDLAKEYLNATK